ncbi:hypothetical protein PJ985_14455 [Streptomyces sp. ACA25]|uniref:hypothetical protein n=1 Tax=Streptomyces sp. ACA25 TaxID=3022596 RepID=UPI002307D7F5|nr:hypothetical protein [Streptomyces sp. ACA25]MDB1088766.1 hypothetical protein [Streptomyces sp. ACA25]
MSNISSPSQSQFYLTQPKGEGAMLFVMQATPRGPELSKIGTFDNRDECQLLAAGLNAALQGGAGVLSEVRRRTASLPGPLGKAITDAADAIEYRHRNDSEAKRSYKTVRAFTENLEQPNVSIFSLFDTTACGDCPDCGCAVDDDCAMCRVCEPDGRGCENCGTVEVTPRTAFALHRQLRSLADMTYVTVQCGFWESGVPDSAETQTDWFLLHCARAYDDLAADLLTGEVPTPRCLAESVALGYAMQYIGWNDTEFIDTDEAYRALPISRFDNDWEFLKSGLFAAGERARTFLTADAMEESLWEEWFHPYPGATPRHGSRGFRC